MVGTDRAGFELPVAVIRCGLNKFREEESYSPHLQLQQPRLKTRELEIWKS